MWTLRDVIKVVLGCPEDMDLDITLDNCIACPRFDGLVHSTTDGTQIICKNE